MKIAYMRINNQINNRINNNDFSKVNFSSKIPVRIFSNIQFPHDTEDMLREETIVENIKTIVHRFIKILRNEIKIDNGDTIIDCFKKNVKDHGLDKKDPIITLSCNNGEAFLYTGQDALNLRATGVNMGLNQKSNPQRSEMYRCEYGKVAENAEELKPGLTIYTTGSLDRTTDEQIYKFEINKADFLSHCKPCGYIVKPKMVVKAVANEMNPVETPLKRSTPVKPQLTTGYIPYFLSTTKAVVKEPAVEQCSLRFE